MRHALSWQGLEDSIRVINFTNRSFGFLALNHIWVSEMLVPCSKRLIGKGKDIWD